MPNDLNNIQSAMSVSSTFFPSVLSDDSSIDPLHPANGVTIWPVSGEKVMLSFVKMEPLAEVPMHHHPHEQAGTVLEGTLELTVGGITRKVERGDAYFIEPNVPHRGVGGESGCVVIDAFSPPREDYRNASNS